MNSPQDSDSDTDHRDDSFRPDPSRWSKIQDMIHTATTRDNAKQVAKILSKKDKKMSAVAVDKMKTLNQSMDEFKVMFNGQPAEIMAELHYQEALIELLRLAGDQTSAWKLVLHETVDPFSGNLVIEPLPLWGIQIREIQMCHARADKIASKLRQRFEEANPPKLSENESDDDQGPSKDQGPPKSDNHRDEKGPDQEQNGTDPDFPDVDDEEFYSRLDGPSCNILKTSEQQQDSEKPRDDPSNDPTDIWNYEIQSPKGIPKTPERPSQLIPDRPVSPYPSPIFQKWIECPTYTSARPSICETNHVQPITANLSLPSLTEIATSSPIGDGKHRDENSFQGQFGRRNDQRQLNHGRIQRDQAGCDRYLQNSITSTRAQETATAQKWGRQRAGQQIRTPNRSGQVKRGGQVNYPVPKRSRTSQVEKMRQMNIQFAECLSIYQKMDKEMKAMQGFQAAGPTQNASPGRARKCSHCSKLAGKMVRHVGPFGGRGKYCLFNSQGHKRPLLA